MAKKIGVYKVRYEYVLPKRTSRRHCMLTSTGWPSTKNIHNACYNDIMEQDGGVAPKAIRIRLVRYMGDITIG